MTQLVQLTSNQLSITQHACPECTTQIDATTKKTCDTVAKYFIAAQFVKKMPR